MTEAKDFLQQNRDALDRVREVGLREFEKGEDGLRLIMHELAVLQTAAVDLGQSILFDCLGDIITSLQSWIDDGEFPFLEMRETWAGVIYELSNYFAFMEDDDQQDLRQSVNYRLIQVSQAWASMQPAPVIETQSDGSWGLFEDEPLPPPSPVMASIPTPPTPPTPPEPMLASHYLICLLGTQQYALPIHQVREILEQRLEKSLPLQRPGIVGLVSVRGLVCPVVDVSHILHSKEERSGPVTQKKRCMVVCEVDRRTFCFHVDDVKQVAAIAEFQDPITPLLDDGPIPRAISHVAHFQEKSVLFVKMREVIPA